MITFVYDLTTNKIGCALIQAGYGATIDGYNLQRFGVENWALAPTDNMKMYKVESQEELDRVINHCITKNKKS